MPPVLALLYDVHGNLPALEAVLADARAAGARRFVLGGDYALFGAWPRETVERLRGLDAEWIRGNVDRWTAAPADAPEAVQDAIARCRELLGEPLVSELAALPESLARERVLYCHASPLSDVRGFSPQAADDDLELLAGADAPRVVFGHTHLAFSVRAPGGVDLVNPGSVGLPAGRGSARRVRRRARRRRARAAAGGLRPRRGGAGRARAARRRRRAAGTPHRAGSIRRDLTYSLLAWADGEAVHRLAAGCEFFGLFEEAGGNILRAAALLEEMLQEYPERNELAREILLCEQEGDRITHDIIQRLNQTFVTPIDREDIYQLASALDDVVDYTEEVADYLGSVQDRGPDVPGPGAREGAPPVRAPDRGRDAAAAGFKDISHYTVEINRLENDGDRIAREAIASLFDNGIDPMVVIRWKDIFERLEDAIDATERVANILEGIVIKNS